MSQQPKIQAEEGNTASGNTYALILSNSISARLTSTSRCNSASLASARRVAWIFSRLIPMLSLVWVVVNSASAVAFSDFRLVSKTAVSALIRLISCLVFPRFSASYKDSGISIPPSRREYKQMIARRGINIMSLQTNAGQLGQYSN